jgi:hypothetical protein
MTCWPRSVCRFRAGCAGSRLPGGQARRPRSLADQSLTRSAQMRFAAVPFAVAAPRLPRRLPALPPGRPTPLHRARFRGHRPGTGPAAHRGHRVLSSAPTSYLNHTAKHTTPQHNTDIARTGPLPRPPGTRTAPPAPGETSGRVTVDVRAMPAGRRGPTHLTLSRSRVFDG